MDLMMAGVMIYKFAVTFPCLAKRGCLQMLEHVSLNVLGVFLCSFLPATFAMTGYHEVNTCYFSKTISTSAEVSKQRSQS